MRCMALADAFRAAGADVRFCVSESTPGTVPELKSAFPDSLLGFCGDIGEVERLERVFDAGADVLVIDHYGIGADYEKAARRFTRSLLVVDDFPNRAHAATHLVDTTHGRRPDEYSAVVDPGTVLMCGSAYAMLRRPFRVRRPEWALMPGAGGRLNVLVSFGMSDAPNVSGLAVKALADLASRLSVTLVLGSGAPHLEALRKAIADIGSHWRLVVDADAERMAVLTAEADLVIGAPGSASYERCCLGKPTLLVQFAENQSGNAAALVEAGAARLIGIMPSVRPSDIGDCVLEMLGSREARYAMSQAALTVTDGRGVERIVAAVL